MPCKVLSAQRQGVRHVPLVSTGSQQSAFTEAGTASLMTCIKVGMRNMWTQKLTCLLSSRDASTPEEALTSRFGAARSDAAPCEGLTALSRSSEKLEPGAKARMLIRTAERTGWGKSRAEARIRSHVTLRKKKHHSTQLCCARVAIVSRRTLV